MSITIEAFTGRRDFVRLPTDISIRYKFLCKVMDLNCDQVFEGSTNNLSGEGCLLIGKIPSLSWIPGMLMGKILIGGNILIPSLDLPIKVLCKLAWIEEIAEGSDRCFMGFRFQEITKENQDEIMKYIIKIQMVHK